MSKDRKEYFKKYNHEYYLKHLKERTEYYKKYRNQNKEKISERKKKYYKNNQSSNKVLTELEEWLKRIIELTANLDEKGTCKNILNKIQKLKEKYK